jgi:hypothetical protein
MDRNLDDDSVPANARVWDFVVPPKSWSILPLSSESFVGKRMHKLAGCRSGALKRLFYEKEDRFAGGHRAPLQSLERDASKLLR